MVWRRCKPSAKFCNWKEKIPSNEEEEEEKTQAFQVHASKLFQRKNYISNEKCNYLVVNLKRNKNDGNSKISHKQWH